jgi:hypothetical protein
MAVIPSPKDWLPRVRFGKRLCRTAMDVSGLTVLELRTYLDDAIAVCRERGFALRQIGVPGPALQVLSDGPLDVLGLMGQFRGIALYVQDDYPIASFLELAFNGDELPDDLIA